MAHFPALPGLYKYMFLYYEPLATFSPIFMYLVWPGKEWLFHNLIYSGLEPAKTIDPRAQMALLQMINCHFLVVLGVTFVFQAARDALHKDPVSQERVVGAILKALAITDITHLLATISCLPIDIRYTPTDWGSVTHITNAMVLFDFFMRIAWFTGVGRTRYYYGQPATATGNNSKKSE